MAAWQVDFSIVPRRALAAAGVAALRPSADADWWAAAVLPSDYRGKLAAVVSPASASSGDLQTWGSEDGNRIDVWSVNGRATKVTARVDVRRLDAKFGAMLLQFARTADAVLVRGDGLVVEPLVGAFGAALRSSAAWRFANDPAAHFAKYSELATDDE
ncbi:MAG: hypothetical protein ACJ79A_02075 [Gemmatimonadaceae bacterium]